MPAERNAGWAFCHVLFPAVEYRTWPRPRLPWSVLIDRSGIVRYLRGDDRVDDGSYVAQIRALLDDTVAPPLISP